MICTGRITAAVSFQTLTQVSLLSDRGLIPASEIEPPADRDYSGLADKLAAAARAGDFHLPLSPGNPELLPAGRAAEKTKHFLLIFSLSALIRGIFERIKYAGEKIIFHFSAVTVPGEYSQNTEQQGDKTNPAERPDLLIGKQQDKKIDENRDPQQKGADGVKAISIFQKSSFFSMFSGHIHTLSHDSFLIFSFPAFLLSET